MTARVALIDDHPLFRIGLRNTLDLDPEIEVVICTGSPRAALEQAHEQHVDVAIVGLVLPEMSGIEFSIELRHLQPTCIILGLSMLEDPIRIASLLRAGASGFVHKAQPPEQILEGVHTVLSGVRYLPPSFRADEIEQAANAGAWPLERLTSREREVLSLIVEGSDSA